MTPEAWRNWIGTPAATRLINQLWPDEACVCGEPAVSGSRCVSCAQFDRDLAAIRQREANDAIVTRFLRSDWTVR